MGKTGLAYLLKGIALASQVESKLEAFLVPMHVGIEEVMVGVDKPDPLHHSCMPCPATQRNARLTGCCCASCKACLYWAEAEACRQGRRSAMAVHIMNL